MEVRMIKRWKPTVSSCRFCPSLTSSPSSSVLSQKALWWLQLVVGCIQLSLSFIKLFSFHNKQKMLTGASASPIERWWFLPLSHSSRTAAWNFDLNLGGCNFFGQLTWKSSIGHWFTCSDKSLKHWLDEIFSPWPPPPQWPTKEDATHTLQRLFSFDNNLHILTLEALEGGGLEVEEPGFQCSRCGTEHFGWNI